jgi:hypothetical protein
VAVILTVLFALWSVFKNIFAGIVDACVDIAFVFYDNFIEIKGECRLQFINISRVIVNWKAYSSRSLVSAIATFKTPSSSIPLKSVR